MSEAVPSISETRIIPLQREDSNSLLSSKLQGDSIENIQPPRRCNACSLGLFALALTLFIYSVQNIFWPLDSRNTVAGIAIIYGGAVQCIVGFLEHFAGRNFNGACLGSFGAMFLARGLCAFAAVTTVSKSTSHSSAGEVITSTVTTNSGLYAVFKTEKDVRHSIAAIDAAFTFFSMTLFYIAARVVRSSTIVLCTTLGVVSIVGLIGTVSAFIDHDQVRGMLCRINGGILFVPAVLVWYSAVDELCSEEGVKVPVGKFTRGDIEGK